jgi:hypothetical protein
MRFFHVTLLVFVCCAVFAAGCTRDEGSSQPATPAHLATPPLRDLTISPADLPACFSPGEQKEKNSRDVGTLARDLGWQAGYVVTFICPSESGEPTEIVHSLAVYPAENMPGIASIVDKQDRSDGGRIY